MEEARQLLGELKARYGDLGISIDSISGKLITSAGAFGRVSEAMQPEALAEVDARIKELREQLAALNKESKEVGDKWGRLLPGNAYEGAARSRSPADKAKVRQELFHLQARRAAIIAGVPDAITPGATSRPSFDAGPSDAAIKWMDRVKELQIQNERDAYTRGAGPSIRSTRLEAQLRQYEPIARRLEQRLAAKRLELDRLSKRPAEREKALEIEAAADVAQLRTELIENEHERALQQIEIRYKKELELAKLAGDLKAAGHAEQNYKVQLEVEAAKQAARVREDSLNRLRSLQDTILGGIPGTTAIRSG